MFVMYHLLLVFMRLLNLFAFYVLLTVHGDESDDPLNTVVVAGNPMSITCGISTNSSVKWNFKNPNEFGEIFVYDGSHTFSDFSVNVVTNGSSKEVTLTKNKTQMEDAGIYKCLVDQQDQLIIRTAHLIVLETDPDCGTNASSEDNGVIEGTYLKMWCNIRFSGDPAPAMKWSRNDGSMYEGTLVNSSRHISYTITKELTAEDNGRIYSCTTYFQPISSTDAQQSNVRRAKNAPSYRYQWNFTAVVWFWPKDLHVEPFKESYNYGNRLRCWGDGGLILTYRWIYSATGAVTNGSYLIIDDTMAQNVFHVYECIAVHEKSHRTISKTVNITITDPSARGFSMTALLAILLPIGGVVVALSFGLILQKLHIRRNTLEMVGQGKQTAHHYDDVDESAITSMTTDMTATEPATATKTEETPTTTDANRPTSQKIVSQISTTRPYYSLASVRSLPDIPVYSPLETTNATAEAVERAKDNPIIEVHYANVPITQSTNEDPVYMDLADKD